MAARHLHILGDRERPQSSSGGEIAAFTIGWCLRTETEEMIMSILLVRDGVTRGRQVGASGLAVDLDGEPTGDADGKGFFWAIGLPVEAGQLADVGADGP